MNVEYVVKSTEGRPALAANLYPSFVLVVVSICAIFSCWRYWSLFGGDPEIHIIFAKNLLAGYPLQFNRGEFTSGETSPVYMVLVAAMIAAVGDYVPLLMKLTGLLSVFGVCMTVFAEVSRHIADRARVLSLSALYLLLPSVLFQAFLGMENALFAFLLVFIVHLWRGAPSIGLKAVLSLIALPLLFLVRPEAVLLLAALGTMALLARDRAAIVLLAAGLMLMVAAYLLIQYLTGVPLQAAGQVRALLSKLQSTSLNLGGLTIFLNPKPLVALAYIAPFAALLLWLGAWQKTTRSELVLLFFLVVTPFLLHVFNVFPSVHFSRYFMYAYAIWFYLFASLIARSSAADESKQRGLLAVVALLAVSMVPFEQLRRASSNASEDYRDAVTSMSEAGIASESNRLYEALGAPPLPVVIGVDEVQLRGRLDERFVIRSLDGIVDYRLRDFVHRDWIDHLGYIKARQINYLFSMPDYNRDRTRLSLAGIALALPNSVVDGLCFKKLDVMNLPLVYKVRLSKDCA